MFDEYLGDHCPVLLEWRISRQARDSALELEALKMAPVSTAKRTIGVTLYRPGTEMQTFTLPEGATLADLLREAGVEARDSGLLIDGRSIEALMTLRPGMRVTILPEPIGAGGIRSWRDTIGMFADDPDFEEMVQAGRAIREADRQAAREEAARVEDGLS